MRTWSCCLNCQGCKSPVAYSLWMPRHDHTRQNTLDGYHPYFTTTVGRISSIDHLTKYYFLYWRNDISERAETVCFWILFFHFLSSFPKYDLEIFSAMDHWDSLNAKCWKALMLPLRPPVQWWFLWREKCHKKPYNSLHYGTTTNQLSIDQYRSTLALQFP